MGGWTSTYGRHLDFLVQDGLVADLCSATARKRIHDKTGGGLDEGGLLILGGRSHGRVLWCMHG